jgi:hypothetical protein
MAHENKGDKDRLIAPGSILLKCVDGRWTDVDGLAVTGEMLAYGTIRGLQRFHGKGEPPDEIRETPDKRLTQDDADVRNAMIPKEEWRDGLNSEPEPPWKLVHVAYLIDTTSATRYTFINSTFSARIAVERLADKMLCMRVLRGADVRPIIKLDSRPMKTSHGQKMRPEFTILDWRDFDGDGGGSRALLGPGGGGGGGGGDGAPLIEHRKTEPTPAAPTTKATTVGKPVKPVSVSEEINDSLPPDLAAPF